MGLFIKVWSYYGVLHLVMVRCLDASEERIASIFRVTEQCHVYDKAMRWKKRVDRVRPSSAWRNALAVLTLQETPPAPTEEETRWAPEAVWWTE